MTLPFAFAPAPMQRGSLRWYLNRLRAMSIAEVGYRAQQALSQTSLAQTVAHTWLGRVGWGDNPWLVPPRVRSPLQPLRAPASWVRVPDRLDAAQRDRILSAADDWAAGRWRRLDEVVQPLDLPADWHRGAQAQQQDPRLWMELHRHAHLVVLAQAYVLERRPAHLVTLQQHLSSWLDHGPRRGKRPRHDALAWSSALDVALRLVNWSIVWQLLAQVNRPVGGIDSGDAHVQALGSLMGDELVRAWIASVPLHVHAIRGNLSRHSSANNHLMGELVGLLVADATWPFWDKHQRWANEAWSSIGQACLAQVAADGVNLEQASWYLGFVFELLAVGVCIARAQRRIVAATVLDRLVSMARFAQSLHTCSDAVLHHGDADGAHATGLVGAEHDAVLRLLELAPALTATPWAGAARGAGAWLSSPASAADESQPSDTPPLVLRAPLPRRFDSGGYYLLGARFGQPDEIKLIADAGELGYLSIAAHGHADALSLRLGVAGLPILVDRGSGYYNIEPAWRHYLRGTLAHNTLCLDGQDQSVYGGPFLWLNRARCRVHSFVSDDAHGEFCASHDGYTRLAGQAIHNREVLWQGDMQRFVVRDALSSRSKHQVAVAWHFDPTCEVSLRGEKVVVRRGPVTVTLAAQSLQPGCWSLHRAEADSPLGWHSPAFGQRVPAPTVLWHASHVDNLMLSTTLDIHIESTACDNKS
jgi:hypothetical protein